MDCDAAGSTVEVNRCMALELERETGRMERYLAAAVERADGIGERNVGASGAEVVQAIRLGQAAWRTGVDQSCDAVYAWWSDGTIRGSKDLGCRIALTRERTAHIWRQYLTYPDSTPPILPEPDGPADES